MGILRKDCSYTRQRHTYFVRALALFVTVSGLYSSSAALAVESLDKPLPEVMLTPSHRGFDQNALGETSSHYCPAACRLQVLPDGLLYKSYLAGVKEPRLASKWVYEKDFGWMWDVNLGGRVGILRYGTDDPLNPQGWQIDLEGAALPRLSLEHERDVVSCDYRAGVPLTLASGRNHYKLAYYHLSAHLGDEWMLRFPGIRRINYSRDVITFGYSNYWTPDLRLYGEVGYAFYRGDYTKPWEFQFGVEYSPAMPMGLRPAPFFAVNGYVREDNDYSGNVTVETGLQWRGNTGHLFRMGMIYFCGMSDQYEFFDYYENKIGMALWYDF